MKKLLLLTILILAGCSTPVPIKPKFPAVPKPLTEACTTLKKIEGDPVSIVDLHKVVVENYTLYYECAVKVEGWNEWYTTQKKIYEEVK
jgi:hypothetical protein